MSAVTDLTDALCLALLATHPNALSPAQAAVLQLPTHATPLQLVHAYSTGRFADSVPARIRTLIADIRASQLPRTPLVLPHPHVSALNTQGMSPKKLHEVLSMASYVARIASHFPQSSLHIVDIGAGQGYLTRTLKSILPSAHILALDADEAQSVGAQRWEARLLPHADPPIAHRVLFITPETLLQTVHDWTSTTSNATEHPVPVLFVALHACGSLTPAILHAFISASRNPIHHKKWYPAALVAVGCCYNLMDPSDYPEPTRHLPISAYHLAAQIPETWLLQTDPPILDPAVELAIRKVTWRAMLNTALEHATPLPPSAVPPPTPTPQNKSATVPARWNRRPIATSDVLSENQDVENGIGITPSLLRLGKLRDSAYKTWNGFLDAAGERLGVVFREEDYEDTEENGDRREDESHQGEPTTRKRKGRDRSFENALGVLHVLRCFLGPVVESTILRHRLAWVRDGLALTPNDVNTADVHDQRKGNDLDTYRMHRKMHVELVNLFDQKTGSGRNVAIVVAPEDVEGVFLSPPRV